MYQPNDSRQSLRTALLLGAASAAALSITPAFAQQDDTIETVVVTGSRIPQQGLYSSSPVTAIGQQEIKFEGTTNVENLLNNLPSVFADQGEAISNGASGTATVNLRDLGNNRTLVLVDGKRLMPGDPDGGAHATAGAADLNMIPAALVDHVEVVTGGASAVYGSDAVAGVVNFVMRNDFEGVELDGNFNIANTGNTFPTLLSKSQFANIVGPQDGGIWDGADADTTLILGTNSADGKGNITMYAGYRNIKAVTQADRNYSACGSAVNYNSSSKAFTKAYNCAGSSTIPEGRFTSVDIGGYNVSPAGHANPLTSSFIATSGHLFNPYNGTLFNFAATSYLQRPDERYNFGAEGHYEINKAVDFYSSVMFMDDHTLAQVGAGGLFQTPFTVNCDNPLLSAQEANAICPPGVPLLSPGNATLLIGRRAVESGPRIDDLRHTEYRMVVGMKGDLGDGWSYDLSAQYGTTIYADRNSNYWSSSRAQRALQVVTDPVTGLPTCKSVLNGDDPSCVPLNIFTPNSISPAALNYVQGSGQTQGSTAEQVISGNVTGDLGQWGIQSPWSKSPVAINFGTEYRQESLRLIPDEEMASGDLSGIGGQHPAADGSYNVAEGFGEVRVPLIQGMPGAEDLSVNGGYRYSSYNNVGDTSTYKYGFEWQPVDDFRFRGSYQRAVRAPNTNELFTPTYVILYSGQDPCANDAKTNAPPNSTTGGVNAASFQPGGACALTGLTPANYGNVLPCPASQCQQQVSGNVHLKPEGSDTWSIGTVITPTFIDGFTATIDYFNISVKNLIGNIGANTIFNSCFGGNVATCSLVHRDPLTNTLWATNNSYVINGTLNTGYKKTSGIDIEANYQTDLNDWGMGQMGALSFNLIGTYTATLITEPVSPSSAFYVGNYDCAGMYGIVCGVPTPKWRHKLRTTWSTPWDVDISLAWRMIGTVKFDGNSSNPNLYDGQAYDPADEKIPDYHYFDLAANWAVRPGIELRAGVNNIFDRDPPFLDSNNIGVSGPPFGNANTFPQVYDSLGRLIFVGATLKY